MSDRVFDERLEEEGRDHCGLEIPRHVDRRRDAVAKSHGFDCEILAEQRDLVTQRYLPDELGDARYWRGVARGAEKELAERIERIREEKERRRREGTGEGGQRRGKKE